MRVVVLGDGLLGLPVFEAYRARGHDARLFARGQLDLARAVPRDAFGDARVVVNAMAITNVDWAEEHPEETRRVNATAAGEVARAARDAGARLQHVSTDYALAPVSVYARTKLEGERLVREEAPDALVARVATTFGPHPKRRDFVKWVLATLAEKGEATVLADMWSSPTYAPEAARFLVEAAERDASGLVHVANAASASRYDMALAAQRAFGAKGTIRQGEYARFAWKAPRAQDTRMPQDMPSWFHALSLEGAMADYARREGVRSV